MSYLGLDVGALFDDQEVAQDMVCSIADVLPAFQGEIDERGLRGRRTNVMFWCREEGRGQIEVELIDPERMSYDTVLVLVPPALSGATDQELRRAALRVLEIGLARLAEVSEWGEDQVERFRRIATDLEAGLPTPAGGEGRVAVVDITRPPGSHRLSFDGGQAPIGVPHADAYLREIDRLLAPMGEPVWQQWWSASPVPQAHITVWLEDARPGVRVTVRRRVTVTIARSPQHIDSAIPTDQARGDVVTMLDRLRSRLGLPEYPPLLD